MQQVGYTIMVNMGLTGESIVRLVIWGSPCNLEVGPC